MTNTDTAERVRRYIVVNQATGRIVATTGGTHKMMERICKTFDSQHSSTFVYDDASAASEYLPQIGPNLPLWRNR